MAFPSYQCMTSVIEECEVGLTVLDTPVWLLICLMHQVCAVECHLITVRDREGSIQVSPAIMHHCDASVGIAHSGCLTKVERVVIWNNCTAELHNRRDPYCNNTCCR